MATIIPFPVGRGAWSRHERDALIDLRKRLEERGLETSFELGMTDEADPWAVFYSLDDGRALAHVARARSGIVLVWADGDIVRASQMAGLPVAVAEAIDHGESPLQRRR